MEGAAFVVNILAVRFNPDAGNLGPKFFENMRSYAIGGPMGTVKHNMQTIQGIPFGKSIFQKNYT